MLRLNKVWLLLVGVVALLALAAVACGGGDDEEEGTKTPARHRAPPPLTRQRHGRTATAERHSRTPRGRSSRRWHHRHGKIILGSHFAQTRDVWRRLLPGPERACRRTSST